jgi:protein-S-isoprenylcysteine O-methyltransferase Ste14
MMTWVLMSLWMAYQAFVVSVFIARVKKEDDMLRIEFKEEWDKWASKVPYRLIPYIY